MRAFFGLVAMLTVLHTAIPHAAAQIAAGQVDDFQQGMQGWGPGGGGSNAPQVIATGGPAGAGDAFLQVRARGGNDVPGSRMTVFNTDARWRGNYPDAGIAALEVDLNNLGNNPLTMRFSLVRFDPNVSSEQVFTQGFELQPGSGWQQARFSLAEEDLFTSGDLSAILSNVLHLRLVHDPRATPTHPQPEVIGLLGIDNVRAVGLPPVEPLPGDYSDNGAVEQADLDLVLLNWGAPAAGLPATWLNERPTEGIVDQVELDGVLLNWGKLQSAGIPASAAPVPEPSTLALLAVSGLLLPRAARRASMLRRSH